MWDLYTLCNLHYVHYSYRYSLHNNPEERIFQLLRCGSLKSRTAFCAPEVSSLLGRTACAIGKVNQQRLMSLVRLGKGRNFY
jgi:hypothetical protein